MNRPDHSPEGLKQMEYDCEDLGVKLDCWFEVEPASRGSREPLTGLQLEPDYPETWFLVHVYLPDSQVDIGAVLYPALFKAIEMAAFENAVEWP